MRSEVQTFSKRFLQRSQNKIFIILTTVDLHNKFTMIQNFKHTFKTFQMFLRFSAQNTFGNPQYVFKNVLSTIFCNRFYEHINTNTKEDEKSRVRNLERCRASKNIFENNILYQLSILYTPNTCVIKIWLLFNSFFYSPSFKTTALGETEIKLNGDITGWYF